MAENSSSPSPEELVDFFQLQLAEIDMLQSMFPNEGEFKLDDRFVLQQIEDIVCGSSEYNKSMLRIGFTILLVTNSESESENEPVELVCTLPHGYPNVPPDIFTRIKHLNRSQHTSFMEELQTYLKSLQCGEMYILPIIEWIKDNIDKYSGGNLTAEAGDTQAGKSRSTFSRLWIYSHHIYSKTKRTDINDFAKELNFTGFVMPGKPGVICVEGYLDDVETFWHRIRRMNWKRIMIKEKEDVETDSGDINELRKFEDFKEIAFDVRAGKGREYHMDLGLFYNFLLNHDCGHVFEMYFGVEGKKS